jgi:hypothetical protein
MMSTLTPYRIEIPATSGDRTIRAFLARWTSLPGLKLLASGAGVSLDGSLRERLAALRELVEPWDFRSGRERLDIEHGSTELPVEADTVLRAAHAMSLDEELAPSMQAYDHCLVLGGTALSSYLRAKYAGAVASRLNLGHVACLGGQRAISEKEWELLRGESHVPVAHGATEFDVLAAAAAEFFPPVTGSAMDREVDHPRFAERLIYRDERGRSVEVVAARPAPGAERATTLDNYRSVSVEFAPNSAVLLITSAIYAPYQLFVSLQAFGWTKPLLLELAAFPPSWIGDVLSQPKNYLQEIRSAILAASTLAAML